MSVAIFNNFVPSESELASYKIIANVAASNPYWKKLGGSGNSEEAIVATIFSVMLLARELGLSPMLAISGGINNIQGKFEISARIMNMLIRKHGHQLKINMINNITCEIWGKRKDTGEESIASYGIEEAKRAGLIKPNSPWEKVPQDMLFARAISRIARRLFPDCIAGCYVEGELQEEMLKQTFVGKPDLPPIEEIKQISTEEQSFELDLSAYPDIKKEEVIEYVEACSIGYNRPKEAVLANAKSNMSGFIETFRNWKKKNDEQISNSFNVDELEMSESA